MIILHCPRPNTAAPLPLSPWMDSVEPSSVLRVQSAPSLPLTPSLPFFIFWLGSHHPPQQLQLPAARGAKGEPSSISASSHVTSFEVPLRQRKLKEGDDGDGDEGSCCSSLFSGSDKIMHGDEAPRELSGIALDPVEQPSGPWPALLHQDQLKQFF